jgi:hypothetical protein
MFRNVQTKIPGSEYAIDKMFLLVTKLKMLAQMNKHVYKCTKVLKIYVVVL